MYLGRFQHINLYSHGVCELEPAALKSVSPTEQGSLFLACMGNHGGFLYISCADDVVKLGVWYLQVLIE